MNPTVALTLILLTLMTGAGVATGALGYSLGREALKGITQPDLRPTAVGEPQQKPRQQMTIVSEEQILAEVNARITGKPLPETPAATPVPAAPTPTPAEAIATPNALPIVTETQGVKLEVQSVEQQGDLLVLNVTISNSNEQPVRFLYSALTMTDNQGRSLNPSTEGLPGELSAKSEIYAGTINIPTDQLEGADTLSLMLPDYPDQQLKLQLSGIPVVR